jgi:isopentenyl-diphosphate delta-isomerase
MAEEVILVNTQDEPIGSMEKMEAHRLGFLHRAFSVFVFNSHGELLLQRRAESKYHSGGLWTNTCCSHPRPGEETHDAANRRLKEEMGMQCKLTPCFTFIYKISFSNGLTEHELDHVYVGRTDEGPEINMDEVSDWKYISINELKKDLKKNPSHYTEWFKISIDRILQYLKNGTMKINADNP